MEVPVQELLSNYTQNYAKLYRRNPREVVDLGEGWVLINGARMSVEELSQLTLQLQHEIDKERAAKRNVVTRLLKWFSTPQASD